MKYIGGELEFFKNANNWKTYWSSFIPTKSLGIGLEVGAGIGANFSYLSKKVSTLHLLEPDSEYCSYFLSNVISTSSKEAKIICGTSDTLNSDVLYDQIYYIDVLEHIENDTKELSRIDKFLKVNGSLYIIVPAHQFFYSNFDKSVGNYRRYSKASIYKLLPPNFEVTEFRYLDSVGFFLSFLNRIINKDQIVSAQKIKIWDRHLISISKITDRMLKYKLGKSIFVVISKICEIND